MGDYEHDHAIMEAHKITASDEYFAARPQLDCNDRRKVYESGFQRAWNEAGAFFAVEIEQARRAVEYYSAASKKRAPAFIPCRIRLASQVRGDYPIGQNTIANAGDYICTCNKWGAVSVVATNGQMLGIRPDEFEVLEWRAAIDVAK